MSFIEVLFRLGICLFRFFFRQESCRKLVVLYSFNTTVAYNGLCEPCLLQKKRSFPLRLSESQVFDLAQIRPNSEAKI